MRFASWITKTRIKTHSYDLLYTLIPLKEGLRESDLGLVYTYIATRYIWFLRSTIQYL